jgi:hypothetical protein
VNDRFWQILLQKSFCGMGLKFSEPYMRRLNNDVGDHIANAELMGDSPPEHRPQPTCSAFNSTSSHLSSLDFSLISQCTHRAHVAFQLIETIKLSLQSIMSKF